MCENRRCALLPDMVRHIAEGNAETHCGKFSNVHKVLNSLTLSNEPQEW